MTAPAKNIITRNYLLNMLEDGQFESGKLPGARKIAQTLNSSFLHTQAVMDALSEGGIFSSIPRSGTYVNPNWQNRILPGNIYADGDRLQEFLGSNLGLFEDNLPCLRLCRKFQKGTFELRVSHYLTSHYKEYLDLSEFLPECMPRRSDFYQEPLEAFRINGGLYGIPFIFSPRVVVFNRELLAEQGCSDPSEGWTWDEFMDKIKFLKQTLPSENIFLWSNFNHQWGTMFFRAGGKLFSSDPNSSDPVLMDSEKSLRAFSYFIELRDLLGLKDTMPEVRYHDEFFHGKCAFAVMTRQNLYQYHEINPELKLGAVELPYFPYGSEMNMMGADVLCIRRECMDRGQITEFLKFMLSAKIQNIAGTKGYGIPLRKKSAEACLTSENQEDKLFFREIAKTRLDYNIFFPELYKLVTDGMMGICTLPTAEINPSIKTLAEALRLFFRLNIGNGYSTKH